MFPAEQSCGVGVPRLKETPTPGPINFVAVYFSVRFILHLKLCLYTVVHLLLEELKISLKSLLSTRSLCHTRSPAGSESESHKNTRTPHPWFAGNECMATGGMPPCPPPHHIHPCYHNTLISLIF